MRNGHLHISQVTYLPQLISSLNSKGVSTDKMIKRSKLNSFDLSNPDGFVPSIFLYNFLEQVQHSQGLYSIAGRFYNDFSLRQAGTFGKSIFLQPSILQLVQSAVKFQHYLRTDNVLAYEIKGNTFSFSFKMFGEPSKTKSIIEDIGLVQVLDTLRYVGGENWFPTEIHTTSRTLTRMDRVLGSGDFRFYGNQAINKVVFPLEFALNDVVPHSAISNDPNLESEDTLSKQIMRLLQATAPGVQLNLDQIAEISEMSSRNLRRKLTAEGASFNQLASNVMLKKASKLLTTSNFELSAFFYARKFN